MVRSSQSAVPHLRRSTLRSVMLQGYNKSVLPVKKHSAHFFENVSAMIQAGLRLPLAFISSKDSSTKTRKTRSLLDDRHLLCSRATSGFTLPFHNRYFWSVGNFVFHKYENQKTIFILDFTSSNTVSCRILYIWIALLIFNSLNLGRRKLKTKS